MRFAGVLVSSRSTCHESLVDVLLILVRRATENLDSGRGTSARYPVAWVRSTRNGEGGCEGEGGRSPEGWGKMAEGGGRGVVRRRGEGRGAQSCDGESRSRVLINFHDHIEN